MRNKIVEVISVLFVVGIFFFVLYFSTSSVKVFVDKLIDTKPYVSLKGQHLVIDDFEFGYGMIEINQVSGDFDKLNKKVYQLLKGKSGTYLVQVKVKNTDNYGKISTSYKRFGSIDASELNKFSSLEFWSKSAGLQFIILKDQLSNKKNEDVQPNHSPTTSQSVENKMPEADKKKLSLENSYSESHAKFVIQHGDINGVSITDQLVKENAYLIIYTNKVDKKVHFANVRPTTDTQSYGAINNVITENIPQTETNYGKDIFSFKWSYFNDYDSSNGMANVILTKIHKEDRIEFICKITLENNDVITLKGHMEGSFP